MTRTRPNRSIDTDAQRRSAASPLHSPPVAGHLQRYAHMMSPRARREVAQLEAIVADREAAEDAFDVALPEGAAEVLEAEHKLHVGRAKAQMAFNQAAIDNAHEAAQPPEPRPLFVRRGGEMGLVERCRLKPGELIFARTPVGEYEAVGHTNSNAEIPNELTYDIQT